MCFENMRKELLEGTEKEKEWHPYFIPQGASFVSEEFIHLSTNRSKCITKMRLTLKPIWDAWFIQGAYCVGVCPFRFAFTLNPEEFELNDSIILLLHMGPEFDNPDKDYGDKFSYTNFYYSTYLEFRTPSGYARWQTEWETQEVGELENNELGYHLQKYAEKLPNYSANVFF